MKTTKQQVLFTFCTLLLITIGFWACRKQDLQTNDLQVTTKELQTWLSKNGGNYAKGVLLTKDANGKFNQSVLNWQQIRHTNTSGKDFYEVPFVFANSNTGNMATFGTNNSLPKTAYKIIFQKSVSGEILSRIQITNTEDTSLSKQFKTKSFNKMYFFDDLQGKRKAVWVGFSNNAYVEVYKKATSSNNNAIGTLSNTVAKQTVELNDLGSCLLPYSSANGSYECWHTPGGDEYDVTCGYVAQPPSIFIFDICSGGSSSWDIDFNYGAFLGSGGMGGNTPPPALTADQQFLKDIKDSTNDPCATKVIDSLKSLTQSLPELFRNIFDSSANINITFKSANNGNNEGAHTDANYTSNNFLVTINTYFQDATTLSKAATILHEMIHAQLMNWYREAVKNNDLQTQQYLSDEYYFFFDSASIARFGDLNFNYMMGLAQPGQHAIMNRGKFRNAISDALYDFAHKLDPNTSVTRAYCDDMAYAGTADSRIFKDLPYSEQTRINDIIEAERGTNTNLTPKGKPCP